MASASPGQPAPAAYDLVIGDDSVEGYQAFVELYPQSPFVAQLRVVIERRRQMIAWSEAVNINTAAAYRAFLATYPYTDLSATARKLLDRALNKPANAAQANAQGNPGSGGPAQGGAPNQSTQPTTLASAPVCPCTTPGEPLKRLQPPPPRRVEAPPRRRPPPDEVIVRRGPPRDDGSAAAAAAAAGFIGGAILGGALSGGRDRMMHEQ